MRLQDGEQNGELQILYETIDNAWEYEYQFAIERDEAGEPVWGEMQSTTNTRDTVVSGLTEGTRYYARIRSRNGKGVSDWSQTVSRLAR
ncbi:Fibronectin type III domain-containing protein [bacterium A37T11]|nr:Fibronectin type III domain-containing protein [bacterium A37T11]